MTLNELD